MARKKKETLMEAAKETVGIGLVSGVGLGAMGALGSMPGMPAQASGVTRAAGAGLTLVGVGRMAKTGMLLADTMKEATEPKKMKKKKAMPGDDIVKKIWE